MSRRRTGGCRAGAGNFGNGTSSMTVLTDNTGQVEIDVHACLSDRVSRCCRASLRNPRNLLGEQLLSPRDRT